MIVPVPRSTNFRCHRFGKPGKCHNVQCDHRIHLVGVRLKERCCRANACIVDEHGYAGICTQDFRNARNPLIGTEIGGNNLHRPAGFSGQTCGKAVEPIAVAGDEDKIIAATCKPVGIDRTDAGRCASDEGCALG